MNDQDKLIEKIKKLEQKWDESDRKSESIRERIYDDEYFGSDDEDTTELAKSLKRREADYDRRLGDFMEEEDIASFDEKAPRKNADILLDRISYATRADNKTMNKIINEFPQENPLYEECVEVKKLNKDISKNTSSLKGELHSCDLNPILPSEQSSEAIDTKKKKSSLLDDFADVSTSMPSYCDPED